MNKEYKELKQIFFKASIASDIQGILHWDMSTNMPKKSRDQRGDQLAYMSRLKHETLSNQKVLDLIQKVEIGDLGLSDLANFNEMKREHLFLSAIPVDLIEALSKASATCEGLWQSARKECDFNLVKNSLKELINLSKEEGKILGERLNCSPYQALIQKYEPQANVKNIQNLFDDLKPFLIESVNNILEVQKKEVLIPINKRILPETQYAIAKFLMKKIGFDFNRGRLDKSDHPFCGGATEDVRITTRYSEINPFSSLEGVMHETGHALYELGLPERWYHQPVGKSRGMAMHESQSLLIEMQITRSLAFKKYLSNLLEDSFDIKGKEFSFQNLYKLGTRVNKNYIRVEADEVTYPLHIMLRFNIEKMLLEDNLKVDDIPYIWNDEFKKMFGIDVDKDTNGCLQDIHWYAGLIGYFPTYTIGALMSAQFSNKLRKDITNLDDEIENGDFKSLINWLKINIHEKASFFSSNEILQKVTNSSLNVKYFKEYISKRYL